jgi:hypothetical protein
MRYRQTRVAGNAGRCVSEHGERGQPATDINPSAYTDVEHATAHRSSLMSHDTLATLLWSLLALSALFTIVGMALRSARVMLVAACLSFVFGIAAIFSIGVGIIVIGIYQVSGAILFRRDERGSASSR